MSSNQPDYSDDDEQMIMGDEEGGGSEDDELIEEDPDELTEPPPDDSILKLTAHEKDVFCLAVSPNGSKLLSGAEDDKAIVWNIETFNSTGEIEHRIIDQHKDSVIKVNFNHNGTLFATADMAGNIFIHDAATNSMLYEIDHCEDLEWTLWHHSFDILFAGTPKGAVHMFLLSKERLEQSKIYVTNTDAACTDAKLLTDGKRLLCVYADGHILLWNLKEATSVSIDLHSPCTTLDLHASMPIAAVGTENGLTALINTTNMNVVARLGTATSENAEDPAEASVETVRFAPANFPWLAVGRGDGILTIYDFETTQPRHECAHDGMAVTKCEWLSLEQNKPRILTACIDGGLRGWDARSGDPILLKSNGSEIFDFLVAKIADKWFLLAAGAHGIIRVFNYEENVTNNTDSAE